MFGIDGPQWFSDPRGLIHLLGDWLGLWTVGNPPAALADTEVMGLSLWEWLSGPSVALTAIMAQVIWTTAGTFMLMFLAGLQDLPTEVEEAAMVDGANQLAALPQRHGAAPAARRSSSSSPSASSAPGRSSTRCTS